MERIDIAKLRKIAGLSQRDLADRLGVRASFLSAIENGRSRVPEEKIEKLKEIFDIDDFSEFMIEDGESATVPPHTHLGEEGAAITQLLQHIHALAHNGMAEDETEQLRLRIDYLSGRNDKLSERVDMLRDEVDDLRRENLRLKELLLTNGIQY